MDITKENINRKREVSCSSDEEILAKKLFGESAELPFSEGSSSDEESPEDVVDENSIVAERNESSVLKPIWHDDDDDNLEISVSADKRSFLQRTTDVNKHNFSGKEYERRLREEFNRNQKTSRNNLKWASIEPEVVEENVESDSDEVEATLKSMTAKTGKYLAESSFLPKGILNFRRMNDITRGHRLGKKPLNAVHFHPSKPVLLTAGSNGVISLFEIGLPPTEEAFLQDVQFQDFPIKTALFSNDGTKVIAGSRRQIYFFCYDLLDGKVSQMRTPKEMIRANTGLFTTSSDGKYIAVQARNEIYVLSIATMEIVCVLSPPSIPNSLQFSPASSNSLLALTESSEICLWDIRNAGELRSFRDDGGVVGTVLRISNNDQFLACGSNTGIVNLYETKDIYSESPKPIAVYDHLTTRVDDIVFSNDAQIMLISSAVKPNAIRLIHLRSRTVFSNFPCKTRDIYKPSVSDFSPNNGYMGIGDMSGFVSVFRLHYFKKY